VATLATIIPATLLAKLMTFAATLPAALAKTTTLMTLAMTPPQPSSTTLPEALSKTTILDNNPHDPCNKTMTLTTLAKEKAAARPPWCLAHVLWPWFALSQGTSNNLSLKVDKMINNGESTEHN
jgi:hypothetical protein